MDIATKAGLNALKAASKNVVHKTAKAAEELIGNKIDDKIVKPKPVSDENLKDAEEITIPPEKREEILNELRQVLKNGRISSYFTNLELLQR